MCTTTCAPDPHRYWQRRPIVLRLPNPRNSAIVSGLLVKPKAQASSPAAADLDVQVPSRGQQQQQQQPQQQQGEQPQQQGQQQQQQQQQQGKQRQGEQQGEQQQPPPPQQQQQGSIDVTPELEPLFFEDIDLPKACQ